MKQILAVGLGGFVGSITRYSLGKWILKMSNGFFPFQTILINVIGCFMIGLLTPKIEAFSSNRLFLSEFVLIGLLGGFTTFSAFGLEVIFLFKQNQIFYAGIYIVSSLILGCLAVYIGLLINY